MKKIYLILLAAAGIFAAASCAREEIMDPSQKVNSGEVTTLTIGFDESKTALVDGKTVWAEGDVIRIYNSTGTFYDDVTVPEDAIGKKSFDIDINMKDTVYYAVYPAEFGNGISGKKLGFKLPANPDGRFASANVCGGEVHNGTAIALRNVTAVLKVNVESNNTVEILQFNAQNNMTGTYTVDFSGTDPVVTAATGAKSATVAVGGVDGVYYIPIAPGSYEESFKVTALKGNGGYETFTSTKVNEVKVNTILNMGTIGKNLTKGLTGEGTETSPYIISDLGEWTAFVASVNLGNPYNGNYLDLRADITEPVTAPVSYYVTSDVQFPFGGILKCNNHTIKVNIDGANCKSTSYVALFGNLNPGASITDLTVEGTVTSTGNYVGGIIGWAHGTAASMITLGNLTNNVTVTGGGATVGGVVAYAYYTNIENCKNNKEITSTATAATGLYRAAGNAHDSNYANGIGGVSGWAQNSTITNCSNIAKVTGPNKVGGVTGVAYWTNVKECSNTADITGTKYSENNVSSQMGMSYGSATGGVIGWLHTSGVVDKCTNSGNIVGKLGIGGIVGLSNTSQSAKYSITNCTNSGNVTANTEGTGLSFPRGIGGMNAGTGGIVGSFVVFAGQTTTFENNNNSGKVYSPAVNAGGIIGLVYDAGNVTKPTYKVFSHCVNTGDVEVGLYWGGGIVGYSFSRYVGRTNIFNCVNHGKVTGARPSGNGTVVGGILGGMGANVATYRTSNDHGKVNNNYNDGEVVSTVNLAVPYCGGIVGNLWGLMYAQNNYNIGYVGPASHEAPVSGADAYLGQIAGRQQGSYVSYCYYPSGGTLPAVGTNGNAAAASVIDFDATLNLSAPVTVNKVSCTTLLQAMSEWQKAYASNGYIAWKAGTGGYPVFVE